MTLNVICGAWGWGSGGYSLSQVDIIQEVDGSKGVDENSKWSKWILLDSQSQSLYSSLLLRNIKRIFVKYNF